MSTALQPAKRPIPFFLVLVALAVLPVFGKGGWLAAAILACILLSEPLFVLIGLVTVLCFLFWTQITTLQDLTGIIERVRELADKQPLLAIPLFIMSGAINAETVSCDQIQIACQGGRRRWMLFGGPGNRRTLGRRSLRHPSGRVDQPGGRAVPPPVPAAVAMEAGTRAQAAA